jgi:DNA polymerase sigma
MATVPIGECVPVQTVFRSFGRLVKFKDQKTGHFVDLNVNDRLGVHNSDLIKQYCQLNPVLRTMIQYIKMWAKPLGLNRPSPTQRGASVTFSSYALVMMTIGFLQVSRLAAGPLRAD